MAKTYEQRINEQIEANEKELKEFVEQANRQVVAYQAKIDVLKALLEPEPEAPEVPAEAPEK